ncbi:GlmU family protein [Phaeodactylibacter luteus]|uniref:Glucose-1-phosphate thymidylyltransferase n=1 Tax=Phaeodactylibacter luteus TaxID=1564516 RepID=A0A5C6RZT6_9BACT|nr:GlmU family protein [Phaeodactylibacter luteus]TXB67613.1 glucose-1-phosphate thymidylyltransferase [Phaeodactylibacter luteus]
MSVNIILFDNEVRDRLLPLTYTRPVCEIRTGILTIREKWERWLNASVAYITQDYLAERYEISHGAENYIINGSVMPSPQLVRLIQQMDNNEAFLRGEELIVAKLDEEQIERLINEDDLTDLKGYDLEGTDYLKIDNLWDIYLLNAQAIAADFELLTKGRKSAPLSGTNRVVGDPSLIFLEEGAHVECAVLNTLDGPIYFGKNSLVMEGCMIRGSFALGEEGVLKMGARIYRGTSLGPGCKVGGEVNNVVMQANSNKSHDGYLGNSVIGEWCNLGADTNASNLKNNYEEVRLWSYPEERFVKTGQQFCGLFMGDHSKTGISTMLNTGTVVGVCANVFGEGFPRNFIPSFSWGGKQGFQTYRTNKAFETIERVMARRDIDFDVQDRLILLRVFEDSARFRKWDKE